MSASSVGAIAAIDRGGDMVARLGTATGLLWLTALPSRLLVVLLIVQALRLGTDAHAYGDALGALAGWTLAAWLVSLYGRQVFVRACRGQLAGNKIRGFHLLYVPWRDMLAHAQAAVLLELLFWATLPALIVSPFLVILAGLAAVASPLSGPGWIKPVRALGLGAMGTHLLLLAGAISLALFLAFINLHILAHVISWTAGGVAGLDVSKWTPLLDVKLPLYSALIFVGATVMVEPFWLAALVMLVHHDRVRTTGADLRDWFSVLRERATSTDGDA